jgi:hypothetical protein
MNAIHRKLTEFVIFIDIQGEDKIETSPLKFTCELEGNSTEEILEKTDKIRKKLLSGLQIHFTNVQDLTIKSEINA